MAGQLEMSNGHGVLATDLDGTLIPLPGNDRNQRDLRTLTNQLIRRGIELVFVTGRHFASVSEAIREHDLPEPSWMICDVGTSLYQRRQPHDYVPVTAYQQHLSSIVAAMPIDLLKGRMSGIDGLRLQEPVKQGRFKLSFYVDAGQLDQVCRRVGDELRHASAPYSLIQSVDPFTGDGLIDLLPSGASKAHALAWWVEHHGRDRERIIFAGDSGNDWAAMTAGYRTVVVANADRCLAERVRQTHQEAGWHGRLCLAEQQATSGVLEGCRRLGLLDPSDMPAA